MKIPTVLVPLDGSPFAEAALGPAREVAERAGARLRLALVHERRPTGPGGDATAAAALELQRWEREYLETVAAAQPPLAGQPVEADLLEGAPGPALASLVSGRRCGLVVMATHGRGPVTRFWLGSVADYLIRHLDCPVLLVRPDPAGQVGGPPRLRRILVPVDSSTLSERILEVVIGVAGPGADITVAQVVEPALGAVQPGFPYPMSLDPGVAEELSGAARRRLDRLVAGLLAQGVTARSDVLVGTGVAARILEAAESGGYDTIALTTHGAGGLRRALIGSVADKVIRGATGHVLVWRPPVE